MPSPLPRLNTRTQKGVLLVSAGILVLVACAAAVFVRQRQKAPVSPINATELRHLSENDSVSLLTIDGELMTATLKNGGRVQAVVTNQVAQSDMISSFDKLGVPIEYNSLRPSPWSNAVTWA